MRVFHSVSLCPADTPPPHPTTTGEEVAIAAAILDLFWRLPRSAVKFLESQPLPGSTLTSTPSAALAPTAAAAAASGGAITAAAGGGVSGGGGASGGGPQQPGLVVLTIQLEEKLSRMPMAGSPQPRTLTSAYREPLLRFLNK